MKKLLLLAVITSALFSSCQKNNSPAPDAKNVPGSIGAKSSAALVTDVYVCGYTVDPGSIMTAVYWKNGAVTRLAKSGPSANTQAVSMAVAGTDVYVVGQENNTACYWKNGVEHIFPQPNPNNPISGASDIAISAGGDVYIVGGYSGGFPGNSSYGVAVMWKNDVMSLLAFNKLGSGASGIFIDGSDVYVCGNAVVNDGEYNIPIYWKNNVWHPFTHTFPGNGQPIQGTASSIVVDKNHNFYIAGNQQLQYGANPVPGYWKDGNFVQLPLGGPVVLSISVNSDNQSVYTGDIGGGNQAMYFKNSTPVTIPNSRGPVYSIAYSDGDVYATGFLSTLGPDGAQQAAYFKNSTPVLLEGTDNFAYRVIVVKH